MIVGHYGVSFACKSKAPSLPLWLLFLAVQFVDILWCIFILCGIEKARLTHGALDLYYMPYTHSLDAALFWSIFAAVAYLLFARTQAGRQRAIPAAVLGLAVFSHWILDMLVHRHDLPLYGNADKVGLGLYRYPGAEFALEIAVLAAGMALYLRPAARCGWAVKYGFPIFGSGLAALQWWLFVVGPPMSPKTIAIVLLIMYFTLAVIAAWLERLGSIRKSSAAMVAAPADRVL